jgi:hypothetical protein
MHDMPKHHGIEASLLIPREMIHQRSDHGDLYVIWLVTDQFQKVLEPAWPQNQLPEMEIFKILWDLSQVTQKLQNFGYKLKIKKCMVLETDSQYKFFSTVQDLPPLEFAPQNSVVQGLSYPANSHEAMQIRNIGVRVFCLLKSRETWSESLKNFISDQKFESAYTGKSDFFEIDEIRDIEVNYFSVVSVLHKIFALNRWNQNNHDLFQSFIQNKLHLHSGQYLCIIDKEIATLQRPVNRSLKRLNIKLNSWELFKAWDLIELLPEVLSGLPNLENLTLRLTNCLILDHNLEKVLRSLQKLSFLDELVLDCSRNPLSNKSAENIKEYLGGGQRKFKLLSLDLYDTEVTADGYNDLVDTMSTIIDPETTHYIA